MTRILLSLIIFAYSFKSQAQDMASNTPKSNDSELYYYATDTIKSLNDTCKVS